MNVIAVANKPPNDKALKDDYDRLNKPGAKHGYNVLRFDDLEGLLKHLRSLVLHREDCIETLEIDAHGRQGSIGGLTAENAQWFGEQLTQLNKFCKNCKIYLTGCNTAISWPPPPKGTMFPLPQLLASSTRCKVYGTVGYTSGTHAEGTTKATPTCHYNGHDYEKVPGCPINGPVNGDDCYKEFSG